MKPTAKPQLIEIPRVFDQRGNLSFIQHPGALPFDIERVYWIFDVPTDGKRDGRALRATAEVIVALSGAFDVETVGADGESSRFFLNKPYVALYLPPMTWRTILNFSSNSVALTLASRPYDEADYIRDFSLFLTQK